MPYTLFQNFVFRTPALPVSTFFQEIVKLEKEEHYWKEFLRYSLEEKSNLLNSLQENFGKEFGINNDSRRQFGQRYRAEKQRIEKILDKNSEQDDEYVSLFKPIFENSSASKLIIEEIKSRKQKAADKKNTTFLAKHYGKNYTVQKLREMCSATRSGVSLLGISDAADFFVKKYLIIIFYYFRASFLNFIKNII